MVEKTRRELLSEAFDASQKEDEDEVVVAESPHGDGVEEEIIPEREVGDGNAVEREPSAEEEDQTEKPGHKAGQRPPAKKQEVGKKPAPTEAEKQEAEAARRDADGKPVKESPVTDKAPQSWKPATREHWAKIPAEARAEITRREKEVQVTLSQTANVRKFASDFAGVIQPFSHLIRAQSSTPLQAVHNLMSTAAGLMTGNENQKAAIVADIIQNYGVDVWELDNILDAISKQNGGKVPNKRQANQQESIPTWAKPLLEQNQKFSQLQQQHQIQMQEAADEEISKVETQPFFDDLREDIADIMEISASRNRKMTVAQAYEKAIELNPEIKKLVTQHKLAARANGSGKQVMSRARRAASVISGAPGARISGKPVNEARSRREQLSDAWDEATE